MINNRSKNLNSIDVDDRKIIEEKITKPNGDTIIKRYSRGRLLGQGGFASVYEFTNLETKELLAGKIISKNSLTKLRARQKLMFEIKIHRALHHQNIVQFERFFEDTDNIYIILELCSNQTLSDLMRRRKRLTEIEIQSYMYQLVCALKYLHSHMVIHRDIKLGNLFLNDKMSLKLGDFGLAAKLEFEGERKRTICGTPNYIAPEIIDGKHGHSYEVDLWSLGVLIYTLAIGRPPFETVDVKETYKKIRTSSFCFPEQIKLTEEFKELVSMLLVCDPQTRLSLDGVLESSFMLKNPFPKQLPTSTLAVPPSNSFTKQYVTSISPDKINKSVRPKSEMPTKILEECGYNTGRNVRMASERNLDDISRDATARDSGAISAGLSERKIAVVSAFNTLDHGNQIWIKKWVDYSNKYGIGYLISNGSTGVYFNDSSKIIGGYGCFYYICRKENSQEDSMEMFSLKKFPETLKKKITLFEHFKKHLDGDKIGNKKIEDVVYIKKWISTEYAIIFRLNNKVVQIRFLDKTELLLCYASKSVSYVDKNGKLEKYPLNVALQAGNKELVRRLNYTTDIISNMVNQSSGMK